MAQAEKSLQNRILNYLNFLPNSFAVEYYSGGLPACVKFGKIIYKSKGKFRPNGIPDVIWLWNGKTIWIETKLGKTQGTVKTYLSKEQKLIHAKIVECGGEVIVIRSFEEMTDYANSLRDGKI